jgi:hypothetical protein
VRRLRGYAGGQPRSRPAALLRAPGDPASESRADTAEIFSNLSPANLISRPYLSISQPILFPGLYISIYPANLIPGPISQSPSQSYIPALYFNLSSRSYVFYLSFNLIFYFYFHSFSTPVIFQRRRQLDRNATPEQAVIS